jgi:hypothetical protein
LIFAGQNYFPKPDQWRLLIVPLKVPVALNDAGKLMEFGIVSGKESLTSLPVTQVLLYQNQNRLFSIR